MTDTVTIPKDVADEAMKCLFAGAVLAEAFGRTETAAVIKAAYQAMVFAVSAQIGTDNA